MAKFVFRMQNILSVKEKLEEQAKADFSLAAEKHQKELDTLGKLCDRLDYYQRQAVSLRESVLDPVALRENAAAQDYVREEIKRQELRVQEAEKAMEEARAYMQECITDRKIYDKLKENAFEQFKEELVKEDGKMVDELVSYTYGEKKKAGGINGS